MNRQANTANLGFLLRKGSRDTGPGTLCGLTGAGDSVSSSLVGWMDGRIEILLELWHAYGTFYKYR